MLTRRQFSPDCIASASLRFDASRRRQSRSYFLQLTAIDQRLIGSIVQRLQQTTWKGRSVKMRSKGQDGKIGVHVVAQKTGG